MSVQGFNRKFLVGLILAAALGWGVRAAGQTPTFEQVVGRNIGDRITLHSELARYVQAVASASDRVVLIDQGETWERRTQYALIISAPENLAKLEAIRTGIAKLADPRRTSAAEAARLVETLPAVGYIGGSIHGFELSGTESLLRVIERLTTQTDPATLQILQNVVAIFDPMLNPDGRDAFAQANHQAIGAHLNPARDDWANSFVRWEAIKFRTNHYYFDLNRDWFAHTQIETRNRIHTFVQWNPQFTIDAHEMGSDAEFYFDPATDPWHKYFPPFAFNWLKKFGAAYAQAFDRAGYEYMTRERYNYYYPGYTTSYSSFSGGIGMLFEQGSSRGLALTRFDGSVRTLRNATKNHYLGVTTALAFAARERTALLREFYDGKQRALRPEAGQVQRFFLPPGGDAALTVEAANLLVRNGIEVRRLTAPVTVEKVSDREGRVAGQHRFPAGTFVVETNQPKSDLLNALLQPDPPFPESFLPLARARADRAENPRFYDITAWSLPLLFNIPGYASTARGPLQTEPVTDSVQVALDIPQAAYAYLLDGRESASVAALYHLLARGYRAAMLLRDTRIAGTAVASGTVVVRVGDNAETVHAAVRQVAQRYGIQVRAVATGQADAGFLPLGSEHVRPVKLPEIALVAEQPVSGYSFGHAWFVLDRRFDIPLTVLRAGLLENTPLRRFTTILLPDLNRSAFAKLLGKAGIARLQAWVRDGGTLVAIGDAALFVAKDLQMAAVKSWADTSANKPARTQVPLLTPGAMLRVKFNGNHWLGAGYPGEMPALVYSSRVLLAEPDRATPRKRLAAQFHPAASLRIAGHIWDDARERLAGAVFAYEEKHGRGRVILIAEDPNFRAIWRGAERLFFNAVIFGHSAP